MQPAGAVLHGAALAAGDASTDGGSGGGLSSHCMGSGMRGSLAVSSTTPRAVVISSSSAVVCACAASAAAPLDSDANAFGRCARGSSGGAVAASGALAAAAARRCCSHFGTSRGTPLLVAMRAASSPSGARARSS
eukprot:7385996-Prymnesium_polylepis.1